MKKIVLLAILMLIISVWLPSHVFVYAKERLTIANGVYQVELSFLSQEEAAGQENLFDKKAVVTVYEDRHTLAIPITHEKVITSVTAKQQGETLKTSLGTTENLVQFDMKNIQQKFVLTGIYKKSTDGQELSFSQTLVIDAKSLPKKQVTSPVNEETDNQQAVDVIDYKLLTYGTEDPSVMNDYVDSTMKVFKRDNRFFAQMHITESDWVTDLTVEQQGKMIEPKVISRKDHTRTIEFEVEDFRKRIKLWVEVNLPELTYSYDYFVELLFNEEQLKKFTESAGQPVENQAKSSMAKRSEELVKPSRPSRLTKPVEKEEAPNKSIPKPMPEEKLDFDRTQDAVVKEDSSDIVQMANEPTEVESAVNQPDSPVISMDVLKVLVLFSLCALSGVLFIRRVIKRKKTVVNR